jgi:hypothetical protein
MNWQSVARESSPHIENTRASLLPLCDAGQSRSLYALKAKASIGCILKGFQADIAAQLGEQT